MDLWQAILLGLIQGLAEFLPVSSSGQLELAKAALGVDLEGSAGLAFTIYLHVGTALATVVVFRKTIWDLLKGLFEFRWNEQTRYLAMIAVSMIPAGEGVFELAKLAVTARFRGQKLGRLLMERAIAFARERGAKRILLYTNHKLTAALHLYAACGFREIPLGENKYLESDRKMELDLS